MVCLVQVQIVPQIDCVVEQTLACHEGVSRLRLRLVLLTLFFATQKFLLFLCERYYPVAEIVDAQQHFGLGFLVEDSDLGQDIRGLYDLVHVP